MDYKETLKFRNDVEFLLKYLESKGGSQIVERTLRHLNEDVLKGYWRSAFLKIQRLTELSKSSPLSEFQDILKEWKSRIAKTIEII